MGLNKDSLVFDPNGTIGECDEIGSFIVSKSGEVIDSTDVGGTEGLNVNVLNDLTATCDLDGIWHTSNNPDPDNVGIIAHTRLSTLTDTQQIFRSTGAKPNSSTVDPDLVHALDVNGFTMAYDSANDEWERLESVNGILKVSIESGTITADQAGFGTCAYSAVSVGSTATDLVASDLTDRVRILVQNLGSQNIYIGCNSSVTTSTGIKIPKGGSYEFDWDDTVDVHAITASGTADVRIQEAAA